MNRANCNSFYSMSNTSIPLPEDSKKNLNRSEFEPHNSFGLGKFRRETRNSRNLNTFIKLLGRILLYSSVAISLKISIFIAN